MPDIEEAERLSRKRARMFPLLGLLLITQQGSFFASKDAGVLPSWGTAVCWLVMASALLIALVSGGFVFQSRRIRAMMNDDVTRANRSSALSFGFVTGMAGAIALYALESLVPGELNTRQALHIVVTLGLLSGLIRFAMLERRALA